MGKTSRRARSSSCIRKVNPMMSACGVMCSDCPAYLAVSRGLAYQQRVVEAWHRIYDLDEPTANISCGGCLGPDEDVFHTCLRCTARRCCLSSGYASCAECSKKECEDLERAQSVWDVVPQIGSSLSPAEFDRYARPYCGHRERLAAARYHDESSGGPG